ncbi:MAG: hypothetical protein H0W64_12420 [Gammaproteobacteria bacterium]|nr:hypothetical protein [Gammaproteobacteria bacterium]
MRKLTLREKRKLENSVAWKEEKALLESRIQIKRTEATKLLQEEEAARRNSRNAAALKHLGVWNDNNRYERCVKKISALTLQQTRLAYHHLAPRQVKPHSVKEFRNAFETIKTALLVYDEDHPANQDFFVRYHLHRIEKKLEVFALDKKLSADPVYCELRYQQLCGFLWAMLQDIEFNAEKENENFADFLESLLMESLHHHQESESVKYFKALKEELKKNPDSLFAIQVEDYAEVEKAYFNSVLQDVKSNLNTALSQPEHKRPTLLSKIQKNNLNMENTLANSIEKNVADLLSMKEPVDYKLYSLTLLYADAAFKDPRDKVTQRRLSKIVPFVLGAPSTAKQVIGALVAVVGALIITATVLSIVATYGGSSMLAPLALSTGFGLITQGLIHAGLLTGGGLTTSAGLSFFYTGTTRNIAANIEKIKNTLGFHHS